MKRNWMYTFALLIFIGAFFLGGCQSEKAPPQNPDTSTVSTATTPAANRGLLAADLSGDWSSNEAQPKMEAHIAKGEISINLVNDDLTMLYWYGTFYPASPLGSVVTSDKIATDQLVLSMDTTKTFTYSGDDTLSFNFTALGITKRIVMTRG